MDQTKSALSAKLAAAKVAAAAASSTQPGGVSTYAANGILRLCNAKGNFFYPDADGVFTPTTQEEYDMLEHLANSNDCPLERL